MRTISLAFLATALSAAAAQPRAASRPFDGLALNVKLTKTAITAMEPLEVELTLRNITNRAVTGAPFLTAVNGNVHFEFTYGGAPLKVAQPVPRGPEKEGAALDGELAAGASASAKFKILHDWDTGAFPFVKSGDYTVTVTVHALDKERLVSAPAAAFTVSGPSEGNRAELQELHATEAFQYSTAPELIATDGEAEEKVTKLLSFQSSHPRSPFIVEFNYIAAIYYDYAARVRHRDDTVKAAEDRRKGDAALKDYISAARGEYLQNAKRLAAARNK